jgi:NlpC/P60 family
MTVLDTAAAFPHVGYRLGGGRGDASTCDCSSYVSDVFGANGVSLTPFTDAIAAQTQLVGTDLSIAQPGDLLLYKYVDAAQPGVMYPHIAIYAGGGQTFACQFPTGSGQYPVLNYPFEVHRVMTAGRLELPGGTNLSPWLLVAGVVAALLLVGSNPSSNPRGIHLPGLPASAQRMYERIVATGRRRYGGRAKEVAARTVRKHYAEPNPAQCPRCGNPVEEQGCDPSRRFCAFWSGRGRKAVLRPIRASRGYSTDVEDVQREAHELERQARRFRGVRAESYGRLVGGVDRPPWAVGFSDAQLQRIAREHGVRASQENWWEAAHLTKGSAELRRLLREGGYREERTRKGVAARASTARSRPRAPRYRPVADLPF